MPGAFWIQHYFSPYGDIRTKRISLCKSVRVSERETFYPDVSMEREMGIRKRWKIATVNSVADIHTHTYCTRKRLCGICCCIPLSIYSIRSVTHSLPFESHDIHVDRCLCIRFVFAFPWVVVRSDDVSSLILQCVHRLFRFTVIKWKMDK